jgi:hypothetical protein
MERRTLDLSIVIVSWNAKAFLLECLRSLSSETESRRAEIIVVDNASADGSPAAVRNEFPHVKLLRNPANLGFAKANNIGIRQSVGRFVCLINSDVKVLAGCFDLLLAYLEQNPSVGILGPKILNADMTLQPSCRAFPNLWDSLCRALALDTLFPRSSLFGRYFMGRWPHDSTRRVDVLSGCFWMVRRQAIDHVGLLDEDFFMYAEDKDWCKRFRKAGWDVVYFPEAQAVHYGEGSSANAPVRFYVEMQRANLQYWKKHHGRPAQMLFLLISVLHQVIRILRGTLSCILKPASASHMKPKIRRSVICLRWLIHGTSHLGYQHE